MMIIPTASSHAHYSSFPDTNFNLLSTCPPVANPILPPDVSPSALKAAIGEESNPNLSQSQLELLAWHYRLGHVGMTTLQRLMSPTKALDRPDTKSTLAPPCAIATKQPNTHNCDVSKCAVCCLANMEKLSPSTTHTSSTSFGILKQNDLSPGDCLSMDQYVVSQPGRTISSSHATLVGGTIFVNHCSGKIFVHHQPSLNTSSTLHSKMEIDREAYHLGFSLKHFRSDNGVFVSKAFQDNLRLLCQTHDASGVGAKHQNGVAERAIWTTSYLARAMHIHAALKWPKSYNINLWPFALSHAAYICNHLPGRDNLSPEEKWTTSVAPHHRHLRRLKPWGCPCYVLDPTIQDGKKIPKWKPRSRQGRFLGLSPSHASSVGLILNPKTKRITLQFHVLYDEFFHTVQDATSSSPPNLDDIDWSRFIDQVGTDHVLPQGDPDVQHLPQLDPAWRTTPLVPPLQREILADSEDDVTAPVPSSSSPSQPGPAGPVPLPTLDPSTTPDTSSPSTPPCDSGSLPPPSPPIPSDQVHAPLPIVGPTASNVLTPTTLGLTLSTLYHTMSFVHTLI